MNDPQLPTWVKSSDFRLAQIRMAPALQQPRLSWRRIVDAWDGRSNDHTSGRISSQVTRLNVPADS